MAYFAYGSNMNLSLMRRLCGWNCRVLGPALLEAFEFGFDLRGYNTIRPKAGEKVWGVLFDVNQKALEALDGFEGYPNVFGRQEVTVTDNFGEKIKAWVFLRPVSQFGNAKPTLDYFKRILTGAMENGLPKEWIDKLKTFSDTRNC